MIPDPNGTAVFPRCWFPGHEMICDGRTLCEECEQRLRALGYCRGVEATPQSKRSRAEKLASSAFHLRVAIARALRLLEEMQQVLPLVATAYQPHVMQRAAMLARKVGRQRAWLAVLEAKLWPDPSTPWARAALRDASKRYGQVTRQEPILPRYEA